MLLLSTSLGLQTKGSTDSFLDPNLSGRTGVSVNCKGLPQAFLAPVGKSETSAPLGERRGPAVWFGERAVRQISLPSSEPPPLGARRQSITCLSSIEHEKKKMYKQVSFQLGFPGSKSLLK